MATGEHQYSDRAVRGGQSLDFVVDQGRRRNMYITVYPDCSVEVKAPRGTAAEEIQQFVLGRFDWIQAHIARFESLSPVLLDQPYTDGATHYYLGRETRLAVSPGLFDSVTYSRGKLAVSTMGWHREDMVGELVEEWYLQQALEYLSARMDACFALVAHLGVGFPELRIGYMKRSWGTCSRYGWVHLNSELVKVSPDCTDYVIVHELCHLKERNHSKKFYGLVAQAMPDWRRRKRMLERYVICN